MVKNAENNIVVVCRFAIEKSVTATEEGWKTKSAPLRSDGEGREEEGATNSLCITPFFCLLFFFY